MQRTSLKNDALHLLFEALVSLAMPLPPRAARLAGAALGLAGYALLGSDRRRVSRQLLDRYDEVLGLPGDPESLKRRRVRDTTRQVFVNLGRWAGELCAYVDRHDRILDRVVLPGRSASVLAEALGRRRGVLYLTGHLGHWELMAWSLAARGMPVSAVGRSSYHPGITDLTAWLRRRAGVDVIVRDDPELPRRLLGALSRGRIVGLFVDQSTSLPSRSVDFLGRPAPTIEAPARLALRHRGGVVFGSCHEMRGGRLCIEIERVSLPQGMDLDGALEVINGHVERAVRAFPDQWVWMHERWKRRVT
ncbi:MAG: lysophospholipid acyltransferase family protein [Deltaproteobacteria bacterium]|nr:lysophospholipid acyltransferase family protein [Deltaproteobacteria bacterium]